MTTNCKIIFEFESHKEEISATWIEEGFKECDDIAEQIFFNPNPKVAQAFDNGEYPEMTVYLDSDPNVKSQVVFDDMASIVYPSKKLGQAQKRTNKT